MPNNLKDELTIKMPFIDVLARMGGSPRASVLDSNVISSTLHLEFGDKLKYVKLIICNKFVEVHIAEQPYYWKGK